MNAVDQARAKQALARNDLELIDRRISRTQRFIARQDISTMARQAGVDQLDELRWERSTVEMALATYQMPDVPTPPEVALAMTEAERDHAAGMEGGPAPTMEQRQRWADADVQYDARFSDVMPKEAM